MLEKVSILSNLSESELQKLSLFCQKKIVREGEYLFHQGDDATAMYILTFGEFEVYVDENNSKKTLGNVRAEEVLGEMALFGEKGVRMASARAVSDSQVIVILDFSIKELTQKYPELLTKLKHIIALRNEQNKLHK